MSSSQGVDNAAREYKRLAKETTGERGLQKHTREGKEYASAVGGQSLNKAVSAARQAGIGQAAGMEAMNKVFDNYGENVQQGIEKSTQEDLAKLNAAQSNLANQQKVKASKDQQIGQALGTAASIAAMAFLASDERLKDYHKIDDILKKRGKI